MSTSVRPKHPQGETIGEALQDLATELVGVNSLYTLQHREDELTYPKMLSSIQRLSDIAHLFGWANLAASLETVYGNHRNDPRPGQVAPLANHVMRHDYLEQLRWMRKCGGDLAGYIRRYGSVKDDEYAGDGGEAIFEADLKELNKLGGFIGLSSVDPDEVKPYIDAVLDAEGNATVTVRVHRG
jgi:hypothetical protein